MKMKHQEIHMPPRNCHLPIPPTRMKSLVSAVADLQHTPKRVQERGLERGIVFWEKTGRTGLSREIFRRGFFFFFFNEPNFFHFLISTKTLKSLTKTSVSRD